MFKIKDSTIHCSRGDKGTIELKVPVGDTDFYEFNAGDRIKFNIYNKKGYEEKPLKVKEIVLAEATKKVNIELTENDTTFGVISNKPVKYWYDITLNDNQTIVCYSEDGAKEFIQYPAKGADE